MGHMHLHGCGTQEKALLKHNPRERLVGNFSFWWSLLAGPSSICAIQHSDLSQFYIHQKLTKKNAVMIFIAFGRKKNS